MRRTIVPQSLTEHELAFKASICPNPAGNTLINTQTVPDIVTKADVDFLLQLVIKDKEVDAVCKQSQFDEHWRNVWRQQGLNPSELLGFNKDPVHENLPLITVSCLDLLKGDLIYQKYRSLFENNDMKTENYLLAKSYLEEAAGYGSYFALNALCTNGLKQIKKTTSPAECREMAGKIHMYAQRAADLHWTPGYLLLANVLQELSLYSKDIYPDAIGNMAKKVFFMNAVLALNVAQKLEAYSYASINNAYQGKTIWEATHGAYSTWFQAKMRLEKMSGTLLKLTDLESASQHAKLIVNEIDKKYKFTLIEIPPVHDHIAPILDNTERKSPRH
jgi:hypothetical protein